MQYHDVIVVGGGLAGLRAAVEVNRRNVKVAVVSRVHPLRSHSVAAQGGVNAALGNHPRGAHDTPEKHAYDTVKGSDFLADQDAVLTMTRLGPERIRELEHWGCPFSRTGEGAIAQRPFGGAGFPRTCFAADRTGHVMMHTLWQQLMRYLDSAEREELTLYPEWLVTALAVDGERCRGFVAMDLASGEVEAFHAEAVIFAAGGAGRLYANTTNALINSGLGLAIPYRAGVPLKDMEFVQFHPTTLAGTNILVTEGCRGEGAYILNREGVRFLAHYDDSRKAMEVAPRDIVARNIMREIQSGRGIDDAHVHLDLRHLGEKRIRERLPGIRDLCIRFAGVDPVRELVPVQPGQHYTMGGIDCNAKGETPIRGLYAAGECACVSVHGANRLGGNSLLETVVFGAIAGQQAAEYVIGKGVHAGTGDTRILEDMLKAERERIGSLKLAEGSEDPVQIRNELMRVMTEKAGIFRDESGLSEALDKLHELKARSREAFVHYKGSRLNFDLVRLLDLKANLEVAEAVIAGALARKESRGSHFRTDFPNRDDENFLKHTLAAYRDGKAVLDSSKVNVEYFKPSARLY